MTLGLRKILKETTSTDHKGKKITNFLILKPTTSGIPKYPIKRMKRLAQGGERVQERQKPQ